MSRNDKLEWKKVAESYPCRSCGAKSRKPCVTANGFPITEPHATRSNDARDNDWKYNGRKKDS